MFGLRSIQKYFWPCQNETPEKKTEVSAPPIIQQIDAKESNRPTASDSFWTRPITINAPIFKKGLYGLIIFMALFILFAYSYREQRLVPARLEVNQFFDQGWHIKTSYGNSQHFFFLLERNLLNKWFYY